jgi:hypothetical protein
VNTSFDAAYRSDFTYNVTAGVGQFNGSYIHPYIEWLQSREPGTRLKILPFSTQTQACNIIANPNYSTAQSPIGCTGSLCQSYLLSGGLLMTTPWPPTNRAGSPSVVVKNVISQHIEFQEEVEPGVLFQEDDCSSYSDNGTTLIAMKFCIAPSRTSENSLGTGKIVQASSLPLTYRLSLRRCLCLSQRYSE